MSVGKLNAAGTPSTTNYDLGRGQLSIALLGSSGLPEIWRDLGNVPNFAFTVEAETLEHFSSRSGLSTRDLNIVTRLTAGGSVVLEELSAENLALFLSGETASVTNPAVAGISQYQATASLVKGRYYDIYDTSTGFPARDITEVGDVTVVHDLAGANDTLVEGTDYTVDLVNGRVFLLNSGSTAVEGNTLHITLTADAAPTATIDTTKGLTQSSQTFALKFISENPVDGDKQIVVQFHKVRFQSDGELALITADELASAPLSFSAEANEDWPDSTSQTVTISAHE